MPNTPLNLGEVELELLRAIYQNGSIEDREGFATKKLMESFPLDSTKHHPSHYLRHLEEAGLVKRDKKATRTYAIALTAQGVNTLYNIEQLITSQGARKASPEVLAAEIYDRLVAGESPDHSACEAEISNLNNRLRIVEVLMHEFEEGKSAWLDVAPKILKALQH